MKRSKILMALTAALVFAGGSAVYVNSSSVNNNACEIAGSCEKCGDGYCAKQCGENVKNCPRDCSVPSAK